MAHADWLIAGLEKVMLLFLLKKFILPARENMIVQIKFQSKLKYFLPCSDDE